MDYQAHYSRLIERAELRVLVGYCEKHHVVPRCIDKASTRTVKLTASEHFVAHQLLVRIYPGNKGLVYAAVRMTQGSKRGSIKQTKQGYARANNKMYSWLRREWMKVITQPWNATRRAAQTPAVSEKSAAAKRGKPSWNKGKKMLEEHRLKLIGRRMPDSAKVLIRRQKVALHWARVMRLLMRPHFLEILNAIMMIEGQRREARGAVVKKWRGISTADRNRQQKIINDNLPVEQREALRSQQSEAAKSGWETMRSKSTPEQISAQRRSAALAYHAAAGRGREQKLARVSNVYFWAILENIARVEIQRRRDSLSARNKSPEMRAKVSAAKTAFYARARQEREQVA